MENLTFRAPGLLFPAISLLTLAYTNCFLGLAGAVRALRNKYRVAPDARTAAQVASLRRRLHMTRQMQTLGVVSLSLCVACLFALFLGAELLGRWLFSGALVFMLSSLVISLRE